MRVVNKTITLEMSQQTQSFWDGLNYWKKLQTLLVFYDLTITNLEKDGREGVEKYWKEIPEKDKRELYETAYQR